MMEFFHMNCVKYKLKKKTLFMTAYLYDKYLDYLAVNPSVS